MYRISIIGSESFIAKNFLEYLEQHNYEIEIFLYDYCEMKDRTKHRFSKIDFDDFSSVSSIKYDVDAILIFTGLTGGVRGLTDYKRFIEVNELYLLHILKGYTDANSTARIIYPSSRLLYKSAEQTRICEEDAIDLRSIYAVNKFAAEQYLKIYSEVFGVDYVVLRICTPFGTLIKENGNYGTYEIFNRQADENHVIRVYGDGSQRKTFTVMEDICDAFYRLIIKEKLDYSTYNLGGQELSMLQIAKHVAGEKNAEIEFEAWPEVDRVVDGGTVVLDSNRFDKEFGMTYKTLW